MTKTITYPKMTIGKENHLRVRVLLLGTIIALSLWYVYNGVARALKKLRTSKETTLSSNDSIQLRPFSKWELLRESKFFPLRAVP